MIRERISGPPDNGENSDKRRVSRRTVLGGIGATAGAAAIGDLGNGAALAQSSKQPQVKSSDEMAREMAKAHRELIENARKAKELREAKPYRDALDRQKKLFEKQGVKNPLYTQYQDALAQEFGITDWWSDEGRKVMRYLNDWYNEN